MNQGKFFFTEKTGAILKTKKGKEIPFSIDKSVFRELVRNILKERPDIYDYDIIVCKAMTKYTGGLKLTKRTESYHTSEWFSLKDIAREEVKKVRQNSG